MSIQSVQNRMLSSKWMVILPLLLMSFVALFASTISAQETNSHTFVLVHGAFQDAST